MNGKKAQSQPIVTSEQVPVTDGPERLRDAFSLILRAAGRKTHSPEDRQAGKKAKEDGHDHHPG